MTSVSDHGDSETPRYPLLKAAIDDGKIVGKGLPDPAKREPRCGPWVDGVCQKCGDVAMDYVSPNSPFGI